MFQYNPKEYERITDPEYEIEYTVNNEEIKGSSITMKEFIRYAFKESNKDFPFEDFLNEYEFLYDDIREQVLLIIRGARIRVRKYFYLPPIYIAFPMRSGLSLSWEPQMSRYLQKMAPHGFLQEESEEDAYKLSENPFSALYHPHIDSSASACYGNWGEILSLSEGAYQTIESLRGFVNDYNGRSTFFNIDPYMFDRKPNTNHWMFPHKIHSFITPGYPSVWQHWSAKLQGVFGNEWLMDMCAHFNLNYQVFQWVSNWFTYSDSTQGSIIYYYQAFDEYVKAGNIKDVEYYNYPGDHADEEGNAIIYGEDDWDKHMAKYQKYDTIKQSYSPSNLSNHIGNWLQQKIGYDFTMGDITHIRQGLKSWVTINLKENVNYKEEYYKYTNRAPLGFRILSLLQTMGTRISSTDGPNYNGSDGSALVFLLASNSNIDQIMETVLDFEDKGRTTLPSEQYMSAYKEAREASGHKYPELEERGILTSNMSFERDSFYHRSNKFEFRTRMPQHYLFGRMMSKVNQAFKALVTTSCHCPVNMQQTFFNTIYDLTPDELSTHSFKDKFNSIEVNEETRWFDMMKHMFLKYRIDEMAGDTSWFWSTLEEMGIKDEGERTNLKICFSGQIYNLNESDREYYQELAVEYWYKFFPQFPNSIQEIRDMRLVLDKEIITQAVLKFKRDIAKSKKEYEDVLKNTLPSVEQGELFSQEIPVN